MLCLVYYSTKKFSMYKKINIKTIECIPILKLLKVFTHATRILHTSFVTFQKRNTRDQQRNLTLLLYDAFTDLGCCANRIFHFAQNST